MGVKKADGNVDLVAVHESFNEDNEIHLIFLHMVRLCLYPKGANDCEKAYSMHKCWKERDPKVCNPLKGKRYEQSLIVFLLFPCSTTSCGRDWWRDAANIWIYLFHVLIYMQRPLRDELNFYLPCLNWLFYFMWNCATLSTDICQGRREKCSDVDNDIFDGFGPTILYHEYHALVAFRSS